jgi:hypothetical protein
MTDKNINFKFIIKLLMSLDMSYIGYLGFLGIDLFKSVLMYSNGSICLIKLLFKMGLFTVYSAKKYKIAIFRSKSS